MARDLGEAQPNPRRCPPGAVKTGLTILEKRPIDRAAVEEIKLRARAEQRGSRLRELREAQNFSAGDLAEAAEINEADIARFERGDIDRARIGTLRRYVEGLGANLRVEVEIGDCPLRLL